MLATGTHRDGSFVWVSGCIAAWEALLSDAREEGADKDFISYLVRVISFCRQRQVELIKAS